jgi:hypothetical protein
MARTLWVALVAAVSVLAMDVFFASPVVRVIRPRIVEPADGATVTPPVTVRWDGPLRLAVTLAGPTQREDLGWRESPFQLEAKRFARAGQYTVRVASPILGAWAPIERRFLVQVETAAAAAPQTGAPNGAAEVSALQETIARLETERAAMDAENTGLHEENAELRRQQAELQERLDQVSDQLAESAVRNESAEAQLAELQRQYALAAEENRLLQARLDNPVCPAWGYLSYPRPQYLSRTSRLVVASNQRGELFQSQGQCEGTRRADRTAASPCVCLGLP